MQKVLCCSRLQPHFPSCSPSAHLHVPSLTHQGSHAVLSHFTLHSRPSFHAPDSPFNPCCLLTFELFPKGRRRIFHTRLSLHCSCFPSGKTLDAAATTSTPASATSTVPSASALHLFLLPLCSGSGRSPLLLDLLEERSPAWAFLPSWPPASVLWDSC